jgi:phosphate starvation-inducible protein PhoH
VDLVEFCVLQHFAFIAQHLMPEQAAHMAKTAHDRWIRHKKELQQERYWNMVKNNALQIGATSMGMGQSYQAKIALFAMAQSNLQYTKMIL